MGECWSDIKGGQQAVGGGVVGGGLHPNNAITTMKTGDEHGTSTSEAVAHFYRSHGAYALFTQLELSLSASKLRDRDILSTSDPMAIGYAKKFDGTLEEIGRTEVVMNSLNPVWIGKFMIAYHFETIQPLLFRVYDIDTKYHNLPVKDIVGELKELILMEVGVLERQFPVVQMVDTHKRLNLQSLKLEEQEYLGEASCILSEIVTKHNKSLTLNLQKIDGHGVKTDRGSINVHAEEAISSRQAFEMIFRCTQLKSKDRFSKSDPFLRISKIVEGGNIIPICKTEVVKNDLNPTWKPVCLTTQQFGNKDNPVLVECFDFDSSGNHALIGNLQKSVADLEILYQEKVGANFLKPSSVRHDHMKTLKSQLYVDGFREKMIYTFLDYISNGFELNFMVAVDFTASNRNPRLPDSLHYVDPSGRLNAYQQAIYEVGEVIQFYDSDKQFPAWGFGGRTDGVVSHCFNLNGSPSESEVYGVNGIMSAYSTALHRVALAGPTLFGQVITKAAQIASQSVSHNQKKYNVLLIITDGVLTDLQETKNALVKASDLPLSILIIGVGGADFKEMEILDGDNGKRLESTTGRVATRDIVQFVPMREVHGGQISIIQALLQELPGQFLTYMRSRNIIPHLNEVYPPAT